MEEKQNIKIIKLIQQRVSERGTYSVGKAAEEILFYKIPLSERERIALRIIKSEEFLIDKTEDDVFVYKNPDYKGSLLTIADEKQLSNLKYIIGLFVAVATAVAIKIFSPTNEQVHPPQEPKNNLLADSSFHWKWKRMSDSISKKQNP